MNKGQIENRTEELLTPIAETHGVTIYDVEYVKEAGEYYLRAFIDKEEGVTIDDCVDVSRALSDVLDKEDYIDDAYTLEVSSPGLTRALKKDRHFAASIGCKVEVKLYQAIDKKKEFTGVLRAFDKDSITVDAEDDDAVNGTVFLRSDISSVRLLFEA